MGAAGREEVWRLERVEGGGGECGGGDGEAAATVVGVMVEAGRAVVMVEGERAEEARAAVWARRGGGEGGRRRHTRWRWREGGGVKGVFSPRSCAPCSWGGAPF